MRHVCDGGPRRRPMYLLTLVSPTFDAEFEQLTMDARRAPQRILSAHPSDQCADVVWYGWPSGSAVMAFPRPEQPEGLAMPRDECVRLADDQRRSTVGPETTEPYPGSKNRRLRWTIY